MRPIKHGATDQSVVIRIVDSADGTPETGVTSATSGLSLSYRREGAAVVALTALNDLATLATAHTDGGLLHIGNGYYRVDPQDAAWASGATGVMVFGGATGMVVIAAYHPLVAVDFADAVRFGLTALPNAAADAAGGLPISDAGGLDLDAKLANTNEVTSARMGALTDWINGGRLDLLLDAVKAQTDTIPVNPASTTNITAGTITTVTNLTNAPTNGDLTATMKTSVTTAATAATPTAAAVTGAVGSVTGNVGGNVVGSVASVAGAVGSVTGNVGGNVTGSVGSVVGAVGSVTGAVGSVTAAVTVGTNNDKTGYGLSSAAVQAIWDAATSALTTVGSVGKWILDKLDVVLSTRLASASYTAPLDATGTQSAAAAALTAYDPPTKAELDSAVAPLATSANVSAVETDTQDIQTRLPAALVSGRMDSSVGAFPLVIDTGKTGAAVLKDLLGWATGDIAKSGNAYAFKDRDGTTLFTLTLATSARTRS